MQRIKIMLIDGAFNASMLVKCNTEKGRFKAKNIVIMLPAQSHSKSINTHKKLNLK